MFLHYSLCRERQKEAKRRKKEGMDFGGVEEEEEVYEYVREEVGVGGIEKEKEEKKDVEKEKEGEGEEDKVKNDGGFLARMLAAKK